MSNSQAMTTDAQAKMAGGGEDGFCEAPQPAHVTSEHRLYATSDADRPRDICDRNGEVVLGLCKVCGRAGAELDKPCTHNAARQGR